MFGNVGFGDVAVLWCLANMIIAGNSELQIRGSIEDNSKIIFLMFQRKHML